MHSNDYEKAFDDFLQRREYDEAEAALFEMVRIAFDAGWKAAGGDPPREHRIFELVTTPTQPEYPARRHKNTL